VANLLETKRGRLTTLFLLYVTEGIPLGFTATAIATEMRRQGLGPAAIGAFVGSLYLPWAWKWAIGPIVDVLAPDKFGRRRAWIVGAQIAMVATLLTAMGVDIKESLGLFTALVFVHNLFGATQDVAIDALACHVLPEDERGVANGLMFGGAYFGQAIGGSGVLYFREALDAALGPQGTLQASFVVVGAAILLVTVFVGWPLKEPSYPPRPVLDGSRAQHVAKELAGFLRNTWRAFTGTRAAMVGVAFALLPAGAMALSLALQSNLCVELGLSDGEIGDMNLWATILSASCCIAGGFVSDRFGRRKMLALFLFCTAIPTAWFAWKMQQHGWVMPVDLKAANRAPVPQELVTALWVATLGFAVPQGLMYGTRTALFMDVTTPAVAATQFTAYMALLNLSISYTARWQGWAAEHWGYPTTLAIDAALGLVSLPLLILMAKPKSPP
jgi:PAT family beta-lactamase induction signal transducer AmpG